MPAVNEKPCHCCAGSGKESDDLKQGRALSGLRLRAGISLRELARRMSISHTLLWQLENGKRHWKASHVISYQKNL